MRSHDSRVSRIDETELTQHEFRDGPGCAHQLTSSAPTSRVGVLVRRRGRSRFGFDALAISGKFAAPRAAKTFSRVLLRLAGSVESLLHVGGTLRIARTAVPITWSCLPRWLEGSCRYNLASASHSRH